MKWPVITGLILFLIATIIVIINDISSSNQNFNHKLDLNPQGSVVWNATSVAYADTILYKGLEKLELDNIQITLVPDQSNVLDRILKGHSLSAFIVKNFNSNYTMYIDEELSRYEMITVFAHELIHLEQKQSMKLIISGDGVYWEDKMYELDKIPTYYNRPWEIDAFDRGSELEDYLRDALY